MKFRILGFTLFWLGSAILLVAATRPDLLSVKLTAQATALPEASPSPTPTGAQRQMKLEQRRAELTKQRELEQEIKVRDERQNGITIDDPEIYDDAMLQQMLRETEIKLGALQTFDQTKIVGGFGAISGASQQISSFGLNIQGPSLPGVQTTEKSGTGSVQETNKIIANNTGKSLENTVSSTGNLPTQDVVTTQPQFNPPTATAPTSSTTMPTGFTISASRILTEQMQLTAEAQMYRLLLRGSLSANFIKPQAGRGNELLKLKTTLGFPITITPDVRYKDAVAIVEVEVEKSSDMGGGSFVCTPVPNNDKLLRCQPEKGQNFECSKQNDATVDGDFGCYNQPSDTMLRCEPTGKASFGCDNGEGEKPMITTLLPQEKTYNVAAITDKSMSIGGGVATQILGVSGSWLWGRKTYYLTQDQDTLALSFQPSNPERVGFRWQFRPVLGRRYVQAGLKRNFVQLAFPARLGAGTGEIGRVTIRTYWRKYDYKKGVVGDIIPYSLVENRIDWDIPRYKLNNPPLRFNADRLEDLGSGQMMVNLFGRFLPGTYVRIGSASPQLISEYYGLRFTAPINDLATKAVKLVAPDGKETELVIRRNSTREKKPPPIKDKKATVETIDEVNSKVTVELEEECYLADEMPLIMVIGGRVFGYSNAPIQIKEASEETEKKGKCVEKGKTASLSAIVPTAFLVDNPKVIVKALFAPDDWKTEVSITGYNDFSRAERLVFLDQGKIKDTQNKDVEVVRFLLYGNRLKNINILSPSVTPNEAKFLPLGSRDETDTLRLIELSKAFIQANKYLVLQRDGERPFMLQIPAVENKEAKPAEPKAQERLTIDEDEAVIQGLVFSDVLKATFKKREITVAPGEDDKSVKLIGLKANGVTTSASIKPIVFSFKSGAKPVTVNLEVVNGKVETISR